MAEVLIASMALKTIGAVVEGNAAQASYRQAAAAHDYNAAVAEQNAAQAYKLADAQEAIQRRKAREVLGIQAGQIAESGVTFSGSALAVAKQSAANAELDSLLIQYGGEMRAKGYLAQATSERYGGDVERANARSARTRMYFNAVAGPLGAYAHSPISAQPTTLGQGYGTAGAYAADAGGPW